MGDVGRLQPLAGADLGAGRQVDQYGAGRAQAGHQGHGSTQDSLSRCPQEGSSPLVRPARAGRRTYPAPFRVYETGSWPGRTMARFTSWMASVTLIPRGQASVQLKAVRHFQTPDWASRISRRSGPAVSRESKMNRWAFTMAAGPT